MEQIYYSKTGGFFRRDVHGDAIPLDAISITEEQYTELLAGQSIGHEIVPGPDGCPINIPPTPQTPAEKSAQELLRSMATSEQQISILKPAVDGGYAKPTHTQLLADWQRYRYELTLVPEQTGWPESPQWPHEPEKVI